MTQFGLVFFMYLSKSFQKSSKSCTSWDIFPLHLERSFYSIMFDMHIYTHTSYRRAVCLLTTCDHVSLAGESLVSLLHAVTLIDSQLHWDLTVKCHSFTSALPVCGLRQWLLVQTGVFSPHNRTHTLIFISLPVKIIQTPSWQFVPSFLTRIKSISQISVIKYFKYSLI